MVRLAGPPTTSEPSPGRWHAAACFFHDHARATLGLCALLTAACGLGLLQLKIDNSPEQLLRSDDPALLLYQEVREEFGTGDWIVVALRSDRADGIYRAEVLRSVHALHRALESDVPHLSAITSLVNARHTYAEGDRLIVDPLMPSPPIGPDQIALLRQRVRANPIYLNSVVSESGGMTTILLELDTFSTAGLEDDEAAAIAGFGDTPDARARDLSLDEKREAAAAVLEIAEPFERAGLEVHVAGGPILETHLMVLVANDVGLFMALAIGITIGLLYLLLRRLSGALLPMVVVVGSLISTMGIMALLDMPLTLVTQILPSFLLVIGVTDSIHILVLFFRHYEAGGDKRQAIAAAIAHSGTPVFWTSITTAGGLASFCTAQLGPVADLGILGPVGVLFAFVYTVVLLPALIALLPLRPAGANDARRVAGRFDRALAAAGAFSVRHPGVVLACLMLVCAIAFLGVGRLRYAHDLMTWLPETDSFRIANETIERDLAGVMIADVLVDSGRPGGALSPSFLRSVEAFERSSLEVRVEHVRVGNAISLADITKEIHRALEEDPGAGLPASAEAIRQELLLFEASDPEAVAEVVDADYRSIRLRLQMPWSDSMLYVPFLAELETKLAEAFSAEASFGITGLTGLMARVMAAMIESLSRSYLIALLVITPMMMIILRSVPLGLASMIPNALPILCILGFMGWFGVALDASNIMIGSIILGIAVDDTIHLYYKLQEHLRDGFSLEEAVSRTFVTTGRALAFTSLVMASGFAIYLFSYTANIMWFGILAAMAIAFAFVGDIFITPALLATIGGARRKLRHGREDRADGTAIEPSCSARHSPRVAGGSIAGGSGVEGRPRA